MICKNKHKYEGLACVECLKDQAVIELKNQILQRGQFSMIGGHVVCDPSALESIANDLGINKSEMRFPALCCGVFHKLGEVRKQSKPIKLDEVTCYKCREAWKPSGVAA